MFRRTKSAETTVDTAAVKDGGKGRPTPTRREAEAAAKLRATTGRDKKKAASKKLRARRGEENAKMRQGMKSGDEKFLPARDQGVVRRFVRDRVDSRLCMAEFLLPLLLVIMAMQYSGQESLQNMSNGLWSATILLVTVDSVFLVWKLKREVKERFPDESTKGTVFYGILRSLQLRFLRMPKSKVKLGQKLPDHY